jgi:DNA-binding Lrp family transcriptional regulator
MSDLDRTILQLARDGVPYRDIQETTGLSEGSVSWRIHRLRKQGHAIPHYSYCTKRRAPSARGIAWS